MIFQLFETKSYSLLLFTSNRVGICLFSLFFRLAMFGIVLVTLHFHKVDLGSLRSVLVILYGFFLSNLSYILSLKVKVALQFGSAQSLISVQYLSTWMHSE